MAFFPVLGGRLCEKPKARVLNFTSVFAACVAAIYCISKSHGPHVDVIQTKKIIFFIESNS